MRYTFTDIAEDIIRENPQGLTATQVAGRHWQSLMPVDAVARHKVQWSLWRLHSTGSTECVAYPASIA